MAEIQAAVAPSRRMVWTTFVIGGYLLLSLVAAAGFPRLDRALNPTAADPGLISFLGTGLAVVGLTAVLSLWPLRVVIAPSTK